MSPLLCRISENEIRRRERERSRMRLLKKPPQGHKYVTRFCRGPKARDPETKQGLIFSFNTISTDRMQGSLLMGSEAFARHRSSLSDLVVVQDLICSLPVWEAGGGATGSLLTSVPTAYAERITILSRAVHMAKHAFCIWPTKRGKRVLCQVVSVPRHTPAFFRRGGLRSLGYTFEEKRQVCS